MLAARDRMAKEAQIEPDILPITVGVGEVHLKVSILLPELQVDPEKAELLRTLGRLAKVSLDGALENLTTPHLVEDRVDVVDAVGRVVRADLALAGECQRFLKVLAGTDD